MSVHDARPGEFSEYLVDYGYRGGRWSMTIKATDPYDARNRIQAAGMDGAVVGEVKATFPASLSGGCKTFLAGAAAAVLARGAWLVADNGNWLLAASMFLLAFVIAWAALNRAGAE